jgi:hypothetical protein
MMRERHVKPSITGMLMSSVMTSGSNSSSASNTSNPLRTAMTRKSDSFSNSWTRWRRISAESSAINSLIMASWNLSHRHGGRRPAIHVCAVRNVE